MSVETAGRPPSPVLAAPPPGERHPLSLEALRGSRPARAGMGLLLAAAVLAVIYLIVLAFTGHFTKVVKIDAQLPPGSNAVPLGAPVEYRNVTVGKLGTEGQGPNGVVTVKLEIYPSKLKQIPKGVQAQVSPLSIFGNQYVNLQAPAHIGAAHLTAQDFVPAYRGAASTSLQGTVTQLYGLLSAVHPADLNTALSAFATGLRGEGNNLGRALAGSSTYLGRAVVPNLSTIQSDLKLSVPASQTITGSAQNITGILNNSIVTGNTITTYASQLKGLLASGNITIDQFATVLQQVEVSLPMLLNDSGPLLRDITQSPTELAQTLSGLTQFASAVANAESQGPYLAVNANLPVVDISAGVNAALGYNNPASIAEALGKAVNPPTYTSANCPEYPGETNPYCGGGGSPAGVQAATAGGWTPAPAPAAPVPSNTHAASGSSNPAAMPQLATSALPTTAALQAVQNIAAALNGGQPIPSPGLAALVLYPLMAALDGGS